MAIFFIIGGDLRFWGPPCISGYIPISGNITVSTIEKLGLEYMHLASGIFIIRATKLDIQLG